ncbi:MAG: hypothetical protein IJB96_09160 [Lachnospira sp.]|nr:hypothetical protein [Lachnospira sp.]
MNEVEFRNWLSKKGVNKKVQSDCVSRLKRIERELNHCDIDEQYRSDRCEYLLSLFTRMGVNESMEQYSNTSLPIGKYYMNTYRHALKQYVKYCEDATNPMN